MRAARKRHPLPTPLPDDEHGRALWIGYEASRWLPFDAPLFLTLSAKVGAPVEIAPSGDGAFYAEPDRANPLHAFLTGWHNGCRQNQDDVVKQVIRELSTNTDLQKLHAKARQKRAKATARRFGKGSKAS